MHFQSYKALLYAQRLNICNAKNQSYSSASLSKAGHSTSLKNLLSKDPKD